MMSIMDFMPFFGALVGGAVGAYWLGRHLTKKLRPAPSCFPGNRPVNIQLETQTGKIDLDRRFANIRKRGNETGGTVRWNVTGGSPGDKVNIVFEVKDGTEGPFPPNSGNPSDRGKYTIPRGGPPIETLSEDVSDEAKSWTLAWKYSIVWFDGNGAIVDELDPAVIIGGDY